MVVKAMPKYQQLKKILREEINRRKLRQEDRIPSEEEIARKYAVSLGTVRLTCPPKTGPVIKLD